MTIDAVLGVDPGIHGGMALLRPNRDPWVWSWPEGDICDVLVRQDHHRALDNELHQMAIELTDFGDITKVKDACFTLLELNPGFAPGGKETRQKLHRNIGAWEFALLSYGFEFEVAIPIDWEARFGLLRRERETKHYKKVRHLRLAKDYFGDLATDHTCDALLIAKYGVSILGEVSF